MSKYTVNLLFLLNLKHVVHSKWYDSVQYLYRDYITNLYLSSHVLYFISIIHHLTADVLWQFPSISSTLLHVQACITFINSLHSSISKALLNSCSKQFSHTSNILIFFELLYVLVYQQLVSKITFMCSQLRSYDYRDFRLHCWYLWIEPQWRGKLVFIEWSV